MAFTPATLITSLALFLGMLGLQEAGRRLGKRQLARDAGGGAKAFGTLEGAVFGLMGLLMAFTFSGAAARFDARRQLVAQEANAIGTAYLRLDLLPATAQQALREDFRQYLDARLATFQNPLDSPVSRAGAARALQLQNRIWSKAVTACKSEAPTPPTMLMLPALNEMIDITTTRAMAMNQHPPSVVYLMLGALTLASALLAGYGMAEGKVRSWAHILGFAALFSITIFVILDLEYPRLGLIRVDEADQVLVELRATMN
ncbi:hypothetical protein GETHLI_29250 [Geothrix limicola]|uniref:DUF4239 domain-containing protein n=1 Tax=Geothrix limicola TaxID=2927978 RepID=A0ABQ5QIB9_9BACT|nr:hypothetical protein [Geothrix limicola]GLH74423.1 hypothetical protein GETHLI_29250 [Geothrix limicola]